jgi:hypothetical protein
MKAPLKKIKKHRPRTKTALSPSWAALEHALGSLFLGTCYLCLQDSTPPPRQSTTLDKHRRRLLQNLTNCHHTALAKKRPSAADPLSPLLSRQSHTNLEQILKPQMQKLRTCVKQSWHELVLKNLICLVVCSCQYLFTK